MLQKLLVSNSFPILYSFRRCPYAMRARMAIAVSGIIVELREVVLRDKPPEMISASPKATVPVLVLPDGKVIDESMDIMRWALAQNDPGGWLKYDDIMLLKSNDGPFKHALDRYKYPHRYELESDDSYRLYGMQMLSDLDARLSGSSYLLGEKLGLTDIAIFPFVRQYAATDQEWFHAQPLPALQSWLGRMHAHPILELSMGKYAQWKNGDEAIYFP